MNVTVIGWYGTETLGDVAIFDGILSIFNTIESKNTFFLGSLYPFYTERTLLEEKSVFSFSAPNTTITIFNVKDCNSCKEHIGSSDIILIGGGPLMNLEELFLLKKCFHYAKKRHIPRLVFGCGIENLSSSVYIDVVRDIFELSSRIVLRDCLARKRAIDLYGNSFDFLCLGDPAIVSIENYLANNKKHRDEYCITVNLRKYTQNEYGNEVFYGDDDFREILKILDKEYEHIMLVPMHTFFIGGDDRYYLTELTQRYEFQKIQILHQPNNLHELYKLFSDSFGCIGMRYHSVVMQTILNGNNLVLNYTNPQEGKISGFLNSLDTDFYKDKIIYLQRKEKVDFKLWLDSLRNTIEPFEYKRSDVKENYQKLLKTVLE